MTISQTILVFDDLDSFVEKHIVLHSLLAFEKEVRSCYLPMLQRTSLPMKIKPKGKKSHLGRTAIITYYTLVHV